MDELKIELLKGMNQYVVDLGDEDALELWITIVPDEPLRADFEDIVENGELWEAACVTFGKIVKIYGE